GSAEAFKSGPVIGEYVARIYQEVRRRPRYIVAEVLE
ncbi:MAG: glycosyltransferase, partial [Candidatus Eisenbacteria bacterium]